LSSTIEATSHRPPLSLHDALPISSPPATIACAPRVLCLCPALSSVRAGAGFGWPWPWALRARSSSGAARAAAAARSASARAASRSEEHTSEHQSRDNLVCPVLLE